jgi:hypothetical protein
LIVSYNIHPHRGCPHETSRFALVCALVISRNAKVFIII